MFRLTRIELSFSAHTVVTNAAQQHTHIWMVVGVGLHSRTHLIIYLFTKWKKLMAVFAKIFWHPLIISQHFGVVHTIGMHVLLEWGGYLCLVKVDSQLLRRVFVWTTAERTEKHTHSLYKQLYYYVSTSKSCPARGKNFHKILFWCATNVIFVIPMLSVCLAEWWMKTITCAQARHDFYDIGAFLSNLKSTNHNALIRKDPISSAVVEKTMLLIDSYLSTGTSNT